MSPTPGQTELQKQHNFLDGQWRECLDGSRHEIVDPATGCAFSTVPNSGPKDAHMAAAAAQAAFDGWRGLPARERARFLKRWHALIVGNSEELAKTISREQGKPLAESRAEVGYGASYVEWFSEEAVRTYGDIIPEQVRGRKMAVTKEPVGVVVAITPWNFPLAMIARKIAPALAAGCTVVAKPAEDTPLTSLALARLAQEAGIPPGVLNVITCSRDNATEVVGAWLTDFRVRKVTFTGSTAVGKHLARESASTLKRLSLELGGNAPFIVFEDADLEAAIDGLMASKFRNGGQTCVCPNRVYVHDAIYEEFAKKLVARVQALLVGPASREDSQIGPLINARGVQKVENHVQDALARGGRVLTGGRRISNEIASGPNYFAPTVIAEANHDMALASEETFGPVVPLFRFSDEDEVVRLANDTPYGLASYFYTRDAGRMSRVTERLQSGLVGINEGVLSSAAAPFGGVKESGYGREGSRYGLDDYMQTKYQCQGGIS